MLWFKTEEDSDGAFIVVFRNCFKLEKEENLEIYFSADERCQLFLDGEFQLAGPERSDAGHWFGQYFSKKIAAGNHCLTARVFCLGEKWMAHGQMSLRHGFFCRENSQLLNQWEYQLEKEYQFELPYPNWGVNPMFKLSGANWDILSGCGGEWRKAVSFEDVRTLHLPELPPMTEEPEPPYRIEDDGKGRILITFDHYVRVRPELTFSGSGSVRFRYLENSYDDDFWNKHRLKGHKGKRNGKFFQGNFSEIQLPGGRNCRFVDFQHQSCRYLEIFLAGDVRLEKTFFPETNYPCKITSTFHVSDPKLEAVLQMALRTLKLCSYDTFMDCPFYEQLMYIGDARLESLSTVFCHTDRRLIEKSIRLLSRSRQPDGQIFSRYPAKIDQIIPSFSPIFILMLHDYAMYNDHFELLLELLPAARGIADFSLQHLDENGLLALENWNFIDWASDYDHGVPPGCDKSGSSLNLFLILALKRLAELEDFAENTSDARKWRQAAQVLQQNVEKTYWNAARGLYADDHEQTHFSEHPQVLAMLIDHRPDLAMGLETPGLTQCSIYFSFYYLEVCYRYRLEKLFFHRLAAWYPLAEEGLQTLPEEFIDPRSDCHAWSSHILYHFYASILGIRPTGFGFSNIEIRPMTGDLQSVSGSFLHPSGEISVAAGMDFPEPQIKIPAQIRL